MKRRMQSISIFLLWIATSQTSWTCDELLSGTLCDLEVVEDSVDISGVKMFYWVYQKHSPDSSDSGLPVLMINGGPGLPHNYMLPLKQVACSGRKVIFYDQVGTGRSTICPPVGKGENPNSCKVDEAHSHLLTLEYYILEVEALVEALDLTSSGYHVFGHSWGSVIAEMFAGTRDTRPPGLVSLVLGGALANTKEYMAAQWDPVEGNLGTLPMVMQDLIKQVEVDADFDNEDYLSIVEYLTAQFMVRTFPPPDCITYSNTVINEDIFVRMVGPSDYYFNQSSVLADMDLNSELEQIGVPVLLVHGTFDIMRGPNIRSITAKLQDVESIVLEKSAHMTMIDQPVEMNTALQNWFARKESEQNRIEW